MSSCLTSIHLQRQSPTGESISRTKSFDLGTHARYTESNLESLGSTTSDTTHPSPVRILLKRSPQFACGHVFRLQIDALLLVSPSVVDSHIHSNGNGEYGCESGETGRNDRRRYIIWGAAREKDVAGYQAHGVCDTNQYWCKNGSLVLVWCAIQRSEQV